MRVIPVIDLMHGQVVRGIAGRRDEYRPIVSQIAADSGPATVARAFVEHFGFDTVYVADLDAIAQAPPNLEAWKAISDAGMSMLLDAGIRNEVTMSSVLELTNSVNIRAQFVIGSESIESTDDLITVAALLSRSWVYFSLDFRASHVLTKIQEWRSLDPLNIATALACMNIGRLIVLDLADVGVEGGPRTLDLCRRIRAAYGEHIELIAGGGVRGLSDLQALSDAGCDAALVASALHDKRLTREELRKLAN